MNEQTILGRIFCFLKVEPKQKVIYTSYVWMFNFSPRRTKTSLYSLIRIRMAERVDHRCVVLVSGGAAGNLYVNIWSPLFNKLMTAPSSFEWDLTLWKHKLLPYIEILSFEAVLRVMVIWPKEVWNDFIPKQGWSNFVKNNFGQQKVLFYRTKYNFPFKGGKRSVGLYVFIFSNLLTEHNFL